jgi:uncharacterized protein (DUF1499 family)
MLKWSLIILGLLTALVAVTLVAARWGVFGGRPPSDLGVRDGRLKAPSSTRNSVTSQAGLWPGHPMREQARIAPLALRGSAVVERRTEYLRVQFTTRWMHFVDDAEFWFDPVNQVIQVRSASRVGREDFGVNRARIEAIRQALGG